MDKLNFGTLLQLAFIVLKLTGHIGWTWVWVLAPTWIGLGLFLTIMTFIVIVKAWRS